MNERIHFLKMEGKEVYKNAVTAMTAAAREVLERSGLSIEEIKQELETDGKLCKEISAGIIWAKSIA